MKRLVILMVILLLAIAGGVFYAKTQSNVPIVLTGIVTADEYIVSAQIQGQLETLKVKEGDVVKQGDLLATIQPGTWQADMSFSEQTVKQMEMQVSQAEADLRFMDAQTKSQIVQAQANVSAAAAQVAQGKADLENAHLLFQREEDAYKRGAESAQTYDQTRTALMAQQAQVDALSKQQDAAEAAVNVAKAGAEQVEARQATVSMNERQLDAAKAQQEKAKVQLGYTDIRAPINGIVDVRASLVGEVVNPGQAIVTLIDPDKLWVRADVEETYADHIRIGDQFQVALPSGETRTGTVYYRAVDADYATQRDVSRTKRDIKTFEIRLTVENKDRALAVGMTAYVTVPAEMQTMDAKTAQEKEEKSPQAKSSDEKSVEAPTPQTQPQEATSSETK